MLKSKRFGIPTVAAMLVTTIFGALAAHGAVRPLDEVWRLRGRQSVQKYVCKDQCPLNVGGCNPSNPPVMCGMGTLGQVCGILVQKKKSLLFCSPDMSGFEDCVNDGNGSCYTQVNCVCTAVFGGFVCQQANNGIAAASGNVPCSKTSCTNGKAQAGCK